ncbi:MAG: endonuclease NucS, partial [Gemmatimonadetes bacterium]|nr:endonuclease NucS [Gemmatimonadota bacterium]
MATRMELWQLDSEGLASKVPETTLSAETDIESAIESDPDLLGIDLLIVGRQVENKSGTLDLLALDSDQRLVVIENKRNRAPREVVAQVIDYAARVNDFEFDEVAFIYAEYRKIHFNEENAVLTEAYEKHFSQRLDEIAGLPKLLVVASRLDDSTEHMIEFLAENFGVPINAVLFQPFEGNLVGRTLLLPDEPERKSSRRRSAARTEYDEESKRFWDAWLEVARPQLKQINLPQKGPRSVLIKRKIIPGIAGSLTMWVSSGEAYAEVQFDENDQRRNRLLLEALKERQETIES